MKKILSLLLALAMCLALCACGGNDNNDQSTPAATEETPVENTEETSTATKEELLSSASKFSCTDYLKEYKDNPVRAEQTYIGQAIRFVGHVEQISADSIVVFPINEAYEFSADCRIKVSLSKDEIMLLSNGDNVAIVGTIAELPIVMNTAYTYPVGDYVAEDLDHMIEIFGNDDNGNGNIDTTDGSFGFFSTYKDAFPLLTGEEVMQELVGTWTIKDQFGDMFEHTFQADGTAVTAYKGGADACYWLVEDGFLYWGTSSREIDTERNTRMEVRKLGDNALIFYESDTGSYNGMSYTMSGAYAVLIKK